MMYETIQDRHHPDDWRVEAIDRESDGEIYVTIFSGHDAQERATEYSDWKNEQARRGLDRQYATSAAISSTHT